MKKLMLYSVLFVSASVVFADVSWVSKPVMKGPSSKARQVADAAREYQRYVHYSTMRGGYEELEKKVKLEAALERAAEFAERGKLNMALEILERAKNIGLDRVAFEQELDAIKAGKRYFNYDQVSPASEAKDELIDAENINNQASVNVF